MLCGMTSRPIQTSQRIRALARKRAQPEPSTPETGPERGAYLRWWLDQHGVSVQALADHAGLGAATISSWVNGGRTPAGIDIVMQGAPETVRAFLRTVRELEPTWRDEDLWKRFGVPEKWRHVWSFENLQVDATVTCEGLEGGVMSHLTWQVTYRPGDHHGLQLWEKQVETAPLRHRLEKEAPSGWHALGRVLYLSPL